MLSREKYDLIFLPISFEVFERYSAQIFAPFFLCKGSKSRDPRSPHPSARVHSGMSRRIHIHKGLILAARSHSYGDKKSSPTR